MKVPNDRNSVQRKLFVSYLWAMIVPMLIFALCVSGYILLYESRKEKQRFLRASDAVVELIYNEFTQIDEYIIGLSVTNWIEKMMYSQVELFDYNRFDPIEIRNYNQQLFVGSILNPFIHTMDLVLNEKNVVFSEGLFLSTINEYLETTFDLRESMYDEMRTLLATHNEHSLVYPVKRFNDSRNAILYIKTIPGKGDSVVRATVICSLDMENITSNINQIIDNNIGVILHYQDQFISGDESLWNAISSGPVEIELKSQGRSKRVRLHGMSYTATATSARGIDIYLTDRNRSYVVRVLLIISFSVLFVIIIVIAAFLIARILANRNYKPLQTLLGIIDSPGKTLDDIENLEIEYSSIYESYRSMLSMSESQSETIFEQQKAMLEYCWQVMLERTHEIGDSLLDKIEEFYPISGYKVHFCAVVIGAGHESIAKDLSEKTNQRSGVLCHLVPYSKFTCVVHHVSNERVREEVFDEIVKHFQYDAKCGVGRSYEDIEAINKSYNEAMLIVNFIQSDTSKRVFFRRDYEHRMASFYFTIAQETRLANFLRNGDYDSSVGIISELLEINMSMNPISPKAMQNLFFAIYLTAIRICGEIGIEIEPQWEPEELLRSNSIDEISMVVYSYLKQLCTIIQDESVQNQHLGEVIKSFITKNLTNPNLSMQLVSDGIQKSVSYTSRIFHQLYNMSFIEYINRNRVDIAARIVKESKRPLKEISKEVGFSSDISFRRSFIRYKGITAGKYRKLV